MTIEIDGRIINLACVSYIRLDSAPDNEMAEHFTIVFNGGNELVIWSHDLEERSKLIGLIKQQINGDSPGPVILPDRPYNPKDDIIY